MLATTCPGVWDGAEEKEESGRVVSIGVKYRFAVYWTTHGLGQVFDRLSKGLRRRNRVQDPAKLETNGERIVFFFAYLNQQIIRAVPASLSGPSGSTHHSLSVMSRKASSPIRIPRRVFHTLTRASMLGALAVLTASSACTNMEMEEIETDSGAMSLGALVAVIHPVGEDGASGVVRFEQVDEGVRITADVEGLSEGLHGFHIHQYGDCTAADATSAGGHFNPAGAPHSGPDAAERHMGDMGNLEAGADGRAVMDVIDGTVDLGMILGRGVIVHAEADDLVSQPTGAAGGRLGCGVIGVANSQ